MSNPYLVQFHEDLKARFPVDGATVTYAEWICRNTRLAGRPYSFEGFEFQIEIANDTTPSLSVIKPSQVGLTEIQVRKFLAVLARNPGTSGIFTFPDEKMFKKNSKTRIRPIVSQPAFGQTSLDDEKPQRSMQLYQIGSSWAHIMGMTEGDATSTPADFLVHDEIDLSNQTMIGLYQSRLQNSVWRWTHAFSTPTHPGYGIDARYQASDQRDYMVVCRACNHWQSPSFTMPFLHLAGYHGDGKLDELDADGVASILNNEHYVKCEKCSRPLDLTDPELREWVPKYPSRIGHGYKITPFSPTHGRLNIRYILSQLLEMKRLDQLRGWYNTVLGETYSDGSSKLEPDQVRAVMKDSAPLEVNSSMPVLLGGDMGKTCHLVLGIPTRTDIVVFHFEQVPSSQIHERIAQLDARYNIVAGCIDRHPYTPDAERIRDMTNRRVLPMEYRGATHFNLKEDEYGALDYVQANRTAVIDAQVRAIRNQATTFCGYGGQKDIVVEHCCDMVRIETDEKPATWEKLTGNDHYLHALSLMRAAMKVRELVAMHSVAENRMFVGLIGVSSKQPQRGLGQPDRTQLLRAI